MTEPGLERKARIAELLLDAARQFGETLEPERVYERFRELLTEFVPHDGVVVSSYDDRDDLIRCDYAWVEGNVIDPSTLPPLPLNRTGGGMQSRVIMTGEPLVFNDVAERVQQVDGTYYNVDREGTVKKVPDTGPAGTSAAMMVPFKHEGRVVGVVQVMSDAGQYSNEQLEIVEGLVGQMAAAVRNARLQKERRRLEAAEAAARAAAAERGRAARVLEAVGDAIFFVDTGGVVRLWNRAAAQMTGLPPERVVGSAMAEVVRDWPALEARIPAERGDTVPRSVTLPVELGGRDLWISVVAVRFEEGVVYAVRDVTVERNLEEERSDLVATISHELRTPIAAVYGAAETLLRRDLDLRGDQGRQLLTMITSQATRLTQIVEEVLLASRIDRGELHVECRAVDVREIVRSTVDAMEAKLGTSVAIDVDMAAERAGATGDGDRIQQILLNLLDNAVKYGGEPVRVRVDSSDGTVRVTVADAGPGIAPAERERIFEKFYRGDPQLTRAPGGTGLGLYISRELARRMGGRLDLGAGPGATFVLELPKG